MRDFSPVSLTANTSLRGDYECFCRSVMLQAGLDLSAYKRTQMERRIRAMANRVGAEDLFAYWRYLANDTEALRAFIDRVTINVSEFYRNPEKFAELREHIIPELLKARRELTIWSAGCSYGAEPYSLWILLHEMNASARSKLLATDVDTGILRKAVSGVFVNEDIKNVSDELRKRYFVQHDGRYQVDASIRQKIEFKQHDLLRDPFPHDVDLILCRNVVIYFNDEAKAQLYRRFFAALRPGGYLLLGSTERIFDARAIGFNSNRPFFYQRPY